MTGSAGVYIVFVVMVATFFNLLFLMLTLRVLCTRLRWRGQPHEAAQSDAERPSLPPVAPTVVLQPDNEVMFARKLAEPGAAQEEAGVDAKEIGPKTEAQGSQKLLNFWVASLPEQSQPEGHQAER